MAAPEPKPAVPQPASSRPASTQPSSTQPSSTQPAPAQSSPTRPSALKRPAAPGAERSSKPAKAHTGERLVSLDAYRGFIMLAMASGGFAVATVVRKNPSLNENETWRFLAQQLDHVEWRGCAFWDLIQPSFMFMVGVSMAYSYANRQARGQSYARMFGHALFRSLVLVALGVFLSSNGATAAAHAERGHALPRGPTSTGRGRRHWLVRRRNRVASTRRPGRDRLSSWVSVCFVAAKRLNQLIESTPWQ